VARPAAGRGRPEQRIAVKVASHIRFGAEAGLVIAFPAQLIRVPARWRIDSVHFLPDVGRLRATSFSVTDGSISFDNDPATFARSCYFYPDGESVREVIGGYRAIVNHIAAARGDPPQQQICAANADGLRVSITENGEHPAIGVVSSFAHHLRLLGTRPANWTTVPIG
jgi:hypothetical protein